MVTTAEAIEYLLLDVTPPPVPPVDYALEAGAGIVRWDAAKLGPQPTPEQIAAVTKEQATEARLGRSRAAAIAALAGAGDPTSVANRAAESVGATRDNDLAETLAALADLLGVTPAQLAARIEQRRAAAGEVPAGTNTPGATVNSATNRLYQKDLVPLLGGAILAGGGDPLA